VEVFSFGLINFVNLSTTVFIQRFKRFFFKYLRFNGFLCLGSTFSTSTH